MTVWRPHQGIRVKAIGLLWNGPRLLVAEVENDRGDIKGVRPLGGTVEFGETWQTALKREFHEELGVEIHVSDTPLVLENIYHHEGQMGHEIIFAAKVLPADPQSLPQEPITFTEDNGAVCTARWYDLDESRKGGPELYPSGLLQELTSH